MSLPTLYLVDDNPDFVDATRFWLEAVGWRVECWTDPAAAVAALCRRDRRRPACLLLDIRMPGMSGLDVQDALAAADAGLPIVIMSGHANVPLAVQAMQKGAITVLEKPFEESALAAALDRAIAAAGPGGAPVVHGPAGEGACAAGRVEGARPVSNDTEPAAESAEERAARERFRARESRLSPREREVLSFVVEGVYNKNIADRIGLSIKTVELYRSRGMAKMQARSVAELTRMMVSGRA